MQLTGNYEFAAPIERVWDLLMDTTAIAGCLPGCRELRDLDRFISRASIELIPVDAEQGQIACSAFTRFGKGRHRAGFNYGDCFAYAAAMSLGQPLLCKGDDFIHTDVPILDVRNT